MIEHERPSEITVASDDRVGTAQIEGLVGIERGVNASENYDRPSRPQESADLVPAQGVAGVNTDSDNIPGLNRADLEGLERFIRELRGPKCRRGRPSEDEHPPRRNHPDAK